MNIFYPSLYFRYLSSLYFKNLLKILVGLSLAFATIDYFQYAQQLSTSSNYKILYIFYMWEQALGLLYPLAIVFALIMTKLSLIKNNTMGALHALGYGKKRLVAPILLVASMTYFLFTILHTTEFSYAKDKASLLLKNELNSYDVNDIFFKYNDTFVYIKSLDPVEKKIEDITIFKIDNYQVKYTIHSPVALFDGKQWDAKDAVLKNHIYENGVLKKYSIEKRSNIQTLKGYKPKIIESLYEGKALNIVDAYNTLKLLDSQNLNTDKIRAVLYNKLVVPLFSIPLLIILFFKLPYHARMVKMGRVIALSLGATFIVWCILFGLNQMGLNGVLLPEMTALLPISLLWLYAFYVYFIEERL